MPTHSTSPLLPLPDSDDALIPSRLLPQYIGISPQTLARWRHEGKGPAFVKIGRMVAYKVAEVRGWLDRQGRKSTAKYKYISELSH